MSHLLPGGGAGYIQGGGVRIFFGDVLGGLKIKIPWGRGGGHIFHQEFGGSDVFHWFLLSLKVKASGGPPRPPISQMILPTISNIQNKKRLQNKLMYCGVTMYPKTLAFYLFIVRFR